MMIGHFFVVYLPAVHFSWELFASWRYVVWWHQGGFFLPSSLFFWKMKYYKSRGGLLHYDPNLPQLQVRRRRCISAYPPLYFQNSSILIVGQVILACGFLAIKPTEKICGRGNFSTSRVAFAPQTQPFTNVKSGCGTDVRNCKKWGLFLGCFSLFCLQPDFSWKFNKIEVNNYRSLFWENIFTKKSVF